MELVSFIFLFTLLTTSIIGYGLLFSLKFSKYNDFTKEKFQLVILVFLELLFQYLFPI